VLTKDATEVACPSRVGLSSYFKDDTRHHTLEIPPASGCLNAVSIFFGVSWSCDRPDEIVPALQELSNE